MHNAYAAYGFMCSRTYRLCRRQKPEPLAHIGRTAEQLVDAWQLTADRHRQTVKVRHGPERILIRLIVADKDRAPPRKRRVGHELAHRRALVEPGEFQLEHSLSGKQFNGIVAPCLVSVFDIVNKSHALARRLSVVQGQRIALVLHQHTGVTFCDRLESLLEFGIDRLCAPGDHRAGRHRPHLGAVSADRHELQRREEFVELCDRASADQRQSAL